MAGPTSWGEGTSSALVPNTSNDAIIIKTPNGVHI